MSDEYDSEAAAPQWALLPDDVLIAVLRYNYGASNRIRDFLHPAAVCRAWRAVAISNELWKPACIGRWPEISSLEEVGSFKELWYRMSKADRQVALREAPAEVQLMVRLTMRYLTTPVDGVDEGDDTLVLAHTFKVSEMGEDGSWACPPLSMPHEMLARACGDIESSDLTSFKGFFEWFNATLTVTAFRSLDGRLTRMLPQTPTELPSPYCTEEDYAGFATFTGFEERVANQSIVLGAQFMPTTPFPRAHEMVVPAAQGGEDEGGAEEEEYGEEEGETFLVWNVERLESLLRGLRLRLGYWPATAFNDPSASSINWQRKFEQSSDDRNGFATFVHCLLSGAAEYHWLATNDDGSSD